jgi:heat shock protein HslJ
MVAAGVLAAGMLAAALLGLGDGLTVGGRGTEPTVADRRFGGSYAVTSLAVDGVEMPLVVPASVDLDAVHGQFSVGTGCNTKLGAFSLLADGQAGVTVAGGSQLQCTAEAQHQEDELLAALSEVSSWSETTGGLVLQSAGGDVVELAR